MPTYRKLHTKTIDSFDFNELPDDFARVCWLLLPLILDSEGRGIYNPAWIRSKMFPLREDVKLTDIQKAFESYASRKMIVIYEVNGKSYFYIPSWKTYQTGTEREAKSNLPIDPELLKSNSGEDQAEVEPDATATAIDPVNESVNLYKFYENNIGSLTGIISDNLDDLEKTYSNLWVKTAIEEAVKSEARNMKYVEAILRRWKKDGFQSKKNGNGSTGGYKRTITIEGQQIEVGMP